MRIGVITAGMVFLVSHMVFAQAEPSDLRWKKNVKPIVKPMQKLTQLRGVTFEWRNDKQKEFPAGRHMGLIAQEVEQVVPEVVVSDREGHKSVDYPKLVALLIEAVKGQQTEIDRLKKQVEKQK